MLGQLSTTFCLILGCCCATLLHSSTSPPDLNNFTSSSDDRLTSPQADKPTSSNFFLKEIFEKYGHNGVITLEGLEHLLENLGLGDLSFDSDHDISRHKTSGENVTFAEIHESSHSHSMPKEKPATVEDDHHHHSNEVKSAPESSSQSLLSDNQSVVFYKEKCMNTTEILLNINASPSQPKISVENFFTLCPIIVYELDQQCRSSPEKSGPKYHHHNHEKENSTKSAPKPTVPVKYVWFYGSMAVIIISVSGMLCVAIIPIIQKCFYQQLIQYLVALAIGSLTGDALLHLLPHAMMAVSGGDGHGHGNENDGGGSHTQSVWIGLMALGGICLFFTAEQAINALNAWKQKRDVKKSASKGAVKVGDVEMENAVGEKLSRQSYNSYGYRYEGVATEMLNSGDAYYDKSVGADVGNDCDKKLLSENGVPATVIRTDEGKEDLEKDLSNPLFHSNFVFPENTETVDVGHESSHHHGHGHSHNHTVPTTAMATAWMVIAGDGLHNFTDGMAIGAAFTNGLTGGLSTSIAVFCHELPHELGDFALLLKAGMSIRQGLFYNGLSSILCFLGMVVGLAIGNIAMANAWVFAGAAGMFLYIALVDMVPELHSGPDDTGSSFSRFLLQAFGIGTGITIMCLIALYEEDLAKSLDT